VYAERNILTGKTNIHELEKKIRADVELLRVGGYPKTDIALHPEFSRYGIPKWNNMHIPNYRKYTKVG
jgi:hypothetical protein